MIVQYFRELFTSGGSVGDLVLNCVETKVSQEYNELLMVPFDASDVKDALFSMHPDKSSGPDGMNPIFIKNFGILWVRM